jgi:hypothetical protein
MLKFLYNPTIVKNAKITLSSRMFPEGYFWKIILCLQGFYHCQWGMNLPVNFFVLSPHYLIRCQGDMNLPVSFFCFIPSLPYTASEGYF